MARSARPRRAPGPGTRVFLLAGLLLQLQLLLPLPRPAAGLAAYPPMKRPPVRGGEAAGGPRRAPPGAEVRLRISRREGGERAQVRAAAGRTLLSELEARRVDVYPRGRRGSSCGGEGICGLCRVRVVAGWVSDPGPRELHLLGGEEAVAKGERMACCARLAGDVHVRLLGQGE